MTSCYIITSASIVLYQPYFYIDLPCSPTCSPLHKPNKNLTKRIHTQPQAAFRSRHAFVLVVHHTRLSIGQIPLVTEWTRHAFLERTQGASVRIANVLQIQYTRYNQQNSDSTTAYSTPGVYPRTNFQV